MQWNIHTCAYEAHFWLPYLLCASGGWFQTLKLKIMSKLFYYGATASRYVYTISIIAFPKMEILKDKKILVKLD